ncbi:MAG TPA: UDP-N-acetylmuramate dehydrogenase [Microthrixaceae bacterium]|nr:UDP-N-acetylmuramate dehydrogenase [Microthrixaceae bacterium]
MSASSMGDALDAVAADARARGLMVREHVPLGPFTTYRVGGAAAVLVEVDTAEELAGLARILAGRSGGSADTDGHEDRGTDGVETLIVGNGSNLLVADGGAPVVAIRLGAGFDRIEIDSTTVVAGGAARLPVVARRSVAAGLSGFEWAVGVPGSIGGAIRMNAGGHGSDMAAVVRSVRVVDLRTGQDVSMPAAACEFSYRHSSIRPHQVVVEATLELREAHDGAAVAAGEELMSEIVQWRRTHQPGGHNAGSVFTNPAGDSAGRLIDTAGCKGLRIGSAEVSTKHANFIQVDADGSANDVAEVMIAVIEAVRDRHGIQLHPETVMVGFDASVLERIGGAR